MVKANWGNLLKMIGAVLWGLHAFGISFGPDMVYLGLAFYAAGTALPLMVQVGSN